MIAHYPEHRRRKRTLQLQSEADEREFWECRKQCEAVRDKWDPGRTWNEGTSVPDAYLEEIRAINLAHQGMLRRRNGWTDRDFERDD